MPEDKKTKEIKDIQSREKILLKGVFYSDNLLSFVYKKAERLSVAIYMVTSFISEDEPTRKRLREKSLELLKNISNLDGSAGDISVSASKTLKTFFEIASILDISANSGMISEMNHNIIKEVILEIVDIIELNFDIRNSSRTLLNPNFFAVKDIFLEGGEKDIEFIKDIYKGQYYKRQKNVLYNSEKPKSLGDTATERSAEEFIEARKFGKIPESRAFSVSRISPKAAERRMAIIRLAKKKNTFDINAVSEVISDCSEKTIQRDLLKMVNEGILERGGKKRWSVYSLKS